ncbi:MAG: hypothetical protein II997_05455 [Clostridia bacterium]|nr:hypothetical protein [Clostridia bacterium]
MKVIQNKLKQVLSLCLVACLCIGLMPLVAFASGTTYYVSPNGTDAGGTTEATAFKTLTAAYNAMVSGDTCIILPGVYHEELNINGKNNLTFAAQTPGTVTITGGDEVTGWVKDTMENVWVANVGAGIYNGDGNIVFQNGELCQEARWPDLTQEDADGAHKLLNLDNYARVEQQGTAVPTITDKDLAELNNLNLTGAYVWTVSGAAYWSYVAKIMSHDKTNHILTLEDVFGSTGYWPRGNTQGWPENIYYIFDHKGLLSCEGEWYSEEPVEGSATGKLYMYHAGNDAPQDVELRSREYTIRVQNAQNITLEGLHVRSGLVSFSDTTSRCTIKDMKLETLDYRMPRALNSLYDGKLHRPSARGAIINGNNHLVVGCEFFNLYGEGINLLGDESRVLNNYFHDFNMEATYADGVQMLDDKTLEMNGVDWNNANIVENNTQSVNCYGKKHLISHNTFKYFGRSAIGGTFTKAVISYNDLSDGNRLTRDGSLFYIVNADFGGSEFHHNVLGESINGEGMQLGLYLDGFTTGMVVYKNLVYGQESEGNVFSRSMTMNHHALGNVIVNNTIVNKSGISIMTADHAHTVFMNNLFQNKLVPQGEYVGVDFHNNVENFSNWTNAEQNDYSLASNAEEAINKGVEIPGVTDGFVGDRPDLGAFEYGAEKWKAGHEFSNATYESEIWQLNTAIPYVNILGNSGFEKYSKSGGIFTIEGWESTSSVTPVTHDAWGTVARYAKEGRNVLKLPANASITKTITGLAPNTAYEVGAYAMVAGKKLGRTEADENAPGTSVSGFPLLTETVNSLNGFTQDAQEHWICYDSLDFGSVGYKDLSMELSYGANAAKTTRTIEIYVAEESASNSIQNGAPSGATKVASYDIKNNPRWISVPFDSVITGNKKVYIAFKGDFYDVSFIKDYQFFYNRDSGEYVALTAESDSGEHAEVRFNGSYMPSTIQNLTITTGDAGTVTVKVSKNGGGLYGFVDQVRMREAYSITIEEAYNDCSLESYTVTDSENMLVYGVQEGMEHIISGQVKNSIGKNGLMSVDITAFDENNKAYTTVCDTKPIEGFGSATFSLTLEAPFAKNVYFIVGITGTKGERTEYILSDDELRKQYSGENALVVQDYSIWNTEGRMLSAPQGGAMNIFEISLYNGSNNDVPMVGILAIYKNGIFVETTYLEGVVSAQNNSTFYVGTVVPSGENVTAKLFAWNNLKELKPLTEAHLFEMTID